MSDDPCRTQWFVVTSLVGGVVTLGVGIANCYYYYKLAHESPPSTVMSTDTAWVLFWVNILVIILSLVIIIWAIVHLVKCPRTKSFEEDDYCPKMKTKRTCETSKPVCKRREVDFCEMKEI